MSATSHKGGPFNWADPFLLDEQLTNEERMFSDTAHQFAEDRLLRRVQDAYLNEHTDCQTLREVNLLGETVPFYTATWARPMCPTGWWRALSNVSTAATAR